MPGPVPKRSSQRRRRNHVQVDRVEVAGGPVVVPELGLDGVHPLARDLYESLRESGQSRWYEPSDWQRARIMVHLLSGLLKAERPSVTMYVALQRDMDALLVTEAERRRTRVEIERDLVDEDEQAALTSLMVDVRARRERLTTA
jgi:hypothetical protein